MREQVQRLLSWRAALGELAIVVVGVIIALGVGSWWDQKQERRLEAAHFIELRIESARNLEELRSTLARMDTLKANTLILIEVVEGARPAPPVDSLVELTWLSFSFATYNPFSTAYDNLLSSGGIQLIRDHRYHGQYRGHIHYWILWRGNKPEVAALEQENGTGHP